jgi:hypothetical protein
MVPARWKNGVYNLLHKSPYGRWVERRHTPPPMRPETRVRLIEEFRGLNNQLSEFLGRDLSHWNR